ncbi:MAG TPA: NADP-dependent oxidoreductase [Cytophagales bacterium]|nr:NADP-dependent oxidoreductase [Cytophagales bacterium]
MEALILKEFGSVDHFLLQEISSPTIGSGDVLVKVKAISLNPVDVKTRAGKGLAGRMKEFAPLILGWDISGVIEEVGGDVKGFKKGDAVFGMVNFPGHGQAYAEYVSAPAHHLALKPENVSHEEAAAATLAALTAWQALVTHAKVQPGEKVLIHAASGGVGHYAVQIGKHLGAYVIGTSSAVNKDFVLEIGADAHIDYTSQRFEDVVKDLDFVLDAIGGDNIDKSLEVIRKGGRHISIPSGLNQAVVEKAKEKGIDGSFFLVQSNGVDMKIIADLLQKGIVKSTVSKVFDFKEMSKAHQYVETGRTRGKVVVVL